MFPKVLAIICTSALFILFEPDVVASTDDAGMERIAQQLSRYSSDLSELENALRAQAKIDLPNRLDDAQRSRIEVQRRELTATADAVSNLISQIKIRETKARQKTLTREDMGSLISNATAVARQSDQRVVAFSKRRPIAYDAKTKEMDIQQEALRNEKQMAEAAFQQWQEQANQLCSQLSQIMKEIGDLQNTGVANNDW